MQEEIENRTVNLAISTTKLTARGIIRLAAKGLAYIAIHEDGTMKSSFAKFMKDEEMQALVEKMNGKPGDFADRSQGIREIRPQIRC